MSSEQARRGSPLGWGAASVAIGLALVIGVLIFWGTTLNLGESRYATIDLPGSQVVELPEGRTDLTFTMALANQTVAIPVLRMSVAPVGGGQDLKVSAHIGDPNADNGVTHVRVGTVQVAHAGKYRISADRVGTASPAPQLHVGAVPNFLWLLFTGLGVGAALVAVGIVGIVAGARRARG